MIGLFNTQKAESSLDNLINKVAVAAAAYIASTQPYEDDTQPIYYQKYEAAYRASYQRSRLSSADIELFAIEAYQEVICKNLDEAGMQRYYQAQFTSIRRLSTPGLSYIYSFFSNAAASNTSNGASRARTTTIYAAEDETNSSYYPKMNGRAASTEF